MGFAQPQLDEPDTRTAYGQHWLWAIALGAIAFAVRLIPVLRGGGLFGFGNYDDGVYYAAATGLVHGRLPYQDFLILHPPGVLLLLAPFALGAQLSSDSYGFAAARLAWMLLGAVNAVLVWRILRPIGLVAAVFGGLGYAVLYPAVYADKSTLLESPATTALLLAIIVLEPLVQGRSLPRGRALAAGALLGVAVSIKVWGILPILIVLGWLLVLRRFRAAVQMLIGSALAAALICLPFFAAAPTAMWNQTVRDQIHRRGGNGVPIMERLDKIVGLGIVGRPHFMITVAAVIALLCCAALAWSYRYADLAPALRRLCGGSRCPCRRRGNRPCGGLGARQTGTNRGRCRGGRGTSGVREWLVRHHLRPQVSFQLSDLHRLSTGLRDLRRRILVDRFRYVEPQPQPELPVHCRSRREFARYGRRCWRGGISQPQQGFSALRDRLSANGFGDDLDQILSWVSR
jgi:hypothetical protein